MEGLSENEAAYFASELTLHEGKYLAGTNPRQQSGFGRDERDWKRYREAAIACVHRDGTYLDVGCANGLLMESVVDWAAERGYRLEPYGLEISPRLAELARRRLPHWQDRIYQGNALDWHPPRQFDYVRTEIVCAPPTLRRELVSHLLTHVVAPGGRLIVVSYGSSRPEGVRAEPLVDELRLAGFTIARVDDTLSETHGFVITRAVTLVQEQRGRLR